MIERSNVSSSYMSKYAVITYASVFALILAGFAVFRIREQNKDFHRTVKAAHQLSAGYDQQFIDMVVKLEDMLAERASFGYAGSRDPMTGTTRAVAAREPTPVRRTTIPRRDTPVAAQSVESAVPQVMQEVDPVRLTAIIYDNTRRTFTAVVMDGARSLSVDVGDRVAGRRVVRITNEEIHLETDTERFIYNILGGNTRIQK